MKISIEKLRHCPNGNLWHEAWQVGKSTDGINIDVPDNFGNGITGLGDLVAVFAKPVARAIDAVAGTNIANCGGCDDRQKKLNQAVPFKHKTN